MKTFSEFMREKLNDPEVKKEYQKLEPFYDLATDVIRLRKKNGFTQKELAQKIESTQAVVSRIENGSANCTIETIQKIGEALGAVLEIRLESQRDHDLLQELIFEPGLLTHKVQNSYNAQLCYSLTEQSVWEKL